MYKGTRFMLTHEAGSFIYLNFSEVIWTLCLCNEKF